MPSLGVPVSPRRQPLAYPGQLVTHSCLLVGAWVYALSPGGTVPDWEVEADGGPLELSGAMRLDEALRRADATPMAGREPVLAFGSNASPGQLLHKFGAGAVVPLTRVSVWGWAIGHSAHISRPGYVPYVALRGSADQPPLSLTVAWLDHDERRLMDASELNYVLVTIDAESAPALLESGERLPSYGLYRGNWGALRGAPGRHPMSAGSQPDVLTGLAAQAWFRRLVPDSVDGPQRTAEVLAANARLREAIRDEFPGRGLVAGDGLDDLVR